MDALHWLSKPGTYSKTVSCGTEVRKIISVKEREILRLEEMLRRARDAYLAGSDTLDEYSVSKHGILAQIDQLRADIESEKSAPASQEESKRQVSDLIDFLESDASTATKNAALTQVVDRIVFSRENGMVSIFFYG